MGGGLVQLEEDLQGTSLDALCETFTLDAEAIDALRARF
jgi:hypothetical protein